MNLLPRINVVNLLVRALMLIAFSASPLMADYFNPAVAADSRGPVFWLDQGGLFATYGNYSRAVEAFKKALALDENRSNSRQNLDQIKATIEAHTYTLHIIANPGEGGTVTEGTRLFHNIPFQVEAIDAVFLPPDRDIIDIQL